MAGDLFHSTTANQTATNKQIGFSNRDVGGSVITVGSDASVGSGAIQVTTLDAAALHEAASLAHDAVVSNTAISQGAMQSYQNALGVVAENQQATQQIGTGQTAQGQSLLSQIGINPSTVIWGAIAIVGIVFALGYFNRRK